MKIAIISDIHSNCYALEAVLKAAKKDNVEGFIVLGDIFGYYPWANETYELIREINLFKIIKGNHDVLVLAKDVPRPTPPYYIFAEHNKNALKSKAPEALLWIQKLKLFEEFTIKANHFYLCHGTPDDPSEGRYYSNDDNNYGWLPSCGEILMMGHVHYPMIKITPAGGFILNPGSVGQPRDGIIFPSWGIFDLKNITFELKRTEYDILKVVKLLKDMDWDSKPILALQKNYSGALRH